MDCTKHKYYLNTGLYADRHVHREDCKALPPADGRRYLGEFYSPMAAVVAALKIYPSADYCKTCNEESGISGPSRKTD